MTLGDLKLSRLSTAEQAAETLRTLILQGELASGAPLRENELAESLGVSRNTIREALRNLAREGLVSQGRHRVATVAQLTAEDIADVFYMRKLLEFGAVDRIASAGKSPDFSVMREAVEELEIVRQADDWQRVIDADRAFHEGLISIAGSPRLINAYAQLEGEIRRGLAVTTRAHRDPNDLLQQHIRLYTLLSEGDYEGFKEVLGYHLSQAEERVTRVLVRDGEGAANGVSAQENAADGLGRESKEDV